MAARKRTPGVRLFDVVVLLSDLPPQQLKRGDVGTVVHLFKDGAYEVEFTDLAGRTIAELALSADDFLVLSRRGRTLLEAAA